MKKLFTLIATAFLCLTASAQVTSLYIAGAKGTVINGQTLADWDIVNTIEVQLNRGKFTLDCKDLTTIAISDKKLSTASWGDWMTELWSAEIKEANIGQPVDLVGPGNMNFTAPWKGDWKLVISSDLKTITATTTTTKPETTYHLVGDGIIGWDGADEYKFAKEADNVYWLDITTALSNIANINIIKDKQWNAWWAPGVAPIAIGETANEWVWQTNPTEGTPIPDGANYTGTIRLELPNEITTGCSVNVTFYPTIREHNSNTNGIEISNAENSVAEYFNLQGVKVAAPANGNVYIVRQGGKVSKQIVK